MVAIDVKYFPNERENCSQLTYFETFPMVYNTPSNYIGMRRYEIFFRYDPTNIQACPIWITIFEGFFTPITYLKWEHNIYGWKNYFDTFTMVYGTLHNSSWLRRNEFFNIYFTFY